MPRFYFNVREGTRFYEDGDGEELPDLDTAEHLAADTAASIGRDRLPQSDARDVTVEVLNEHRHRLITVTITMEINRVSPSPVAPLAGLVEHESKSEEALWAVAGAERSRRASPARDAGNG